MSVKPFHFFVQGPPKTSHLSESTSQAFLYYDLLGPCDLQPTVPPLFPFSAHFLIFPFSFYSTLKVIFAASQTSKCSLALGLGPLHLPFFLLLPSFLPDTHKASSFIYNLSYPNDTSWHNCIKYGNCIEKTLLHFSFTHILTICHRSRFWSTNVWRFSYTKQSPMISAGYPTI